MSKATSDMSQNELDEALDQMMQTPLEPGPSPELKAVTVLAMSRQAAQLNRRRVLRYPVIAAGVLILLLARLLLLSENGSPTFAQVVAQVQKTKTLQGKHDELGMYQGLPFYIKGNLERWEGNNPYGFGSWTLIADRSNEETFNIVPNQKTVFRDRGAQSIRGLYQMIQDAAANPVEALGDEVIDGGKLTGFSGSMKQVGADGTTTAMPVHVWVDPKTKLPVRFEIIDNITGKVAGALTDLRFDEPIDDTLFATVVPEGYRVEDKRDRVVPQTRPLATTQQAQHLILHPGVGIGDVKLGDSPAKLISLLGGAEAKENYGINAKEQYFKYPSVGLRISIAWDPQRFPDDGRKLNPDDMTVQQVFADSAIDSRPSRDFPGATDRGVRIGTMRKEVEATYGKPAWENMNNADYRKLGLAVFYGAGGDKVSGFMILKASDEPIFGFMEDQLGPSTAPTTQHESKGK